MNVEFIMPPRGQNQIDLWDIMREVYSNKKLVYIFTANSLLHFYSLWSDKNSCVTGSTRSPIKLRSFAARSNALGFAWHCWRVFSVQPLLAQLYLKR